MKTKRIAFVGGGNMAEAIIAGLLAGGLTLEKNLVAADVSAARRALLGQQYGIDAVAENCAAVREADVVVLAVKPQQAAEALTVAFCALTGR